MAHHIEPDGFFCRDWSRFSRSRFRFAFSAASRASMSLTSAAIASVFPAIFDAEASDMGVPTLTVANVLLGERWQHSEDPTCCYL